MTFHAAALKLRARFLLLLVPRLLAGRCTATWLVSYALALADSGSRRLCRWCWDRALRSSAHDEQTCDALFDLCAETEHYEEAEELANRYFDASGLLPATALRLTGKLVLNGRFDSASRIYGRLVQQCGDDLARHSPAPPWRRPVCGGDFRSMLAERAAVATSDRSTSVALDLALAKLCFSFAAYDTSAKLFERANEHVALDVEERLAHAYAVLRMGGAARISRLVEEPPSVAEALTMDADWQILLATVLFAGGASEAAASTVETALRSRLAQHRDLERVVVDCRRMVACITNRRDGLTFSAGDTWQPAAAHNPGIRKLFVCGQGWTGSSALYDALMEYDNLSETPEIRADRYLDPCTESEMMFVQGAAGLGRVWRTAKQDLKLSQRDLWELFRCNVLGGGAIGHTEHKTARASSTLLERFGDRYTAVFRRAYESLAALPEDAPIGELRSILVDTTESLTTTLADCGEGDCVVFNNAVFGRNIDMLEVFSNFRAAVVIRQPLDQYADRRAKDLKHWMTPSRFVPFHCQSRQAFNSRRAQLPLEHAREVQEVEFERFVLNEPYRQSIISWLLEGRSTRRVRRRFQPERSAKNIGIHADLLTREECEVIEKELKRWQTS